MNILQNENLIIESKNSGAELTRIYSKKNKKDILWCCLLYTSAKRISVDEKLKII